jgi:hypothetical protein
MSSSNRKPYLTATSIDQALLNAAGDNLSNQIELIVDIEAPDGSIIRASDRNKYVGEHFYEALTNFPDVIRTVGEWLNGGLVFSEMNFELSNADGRFNKFLPGGDDFAGWIGRQITVKIGLRDVESSFFQIFRGEVTDEAGFGRTVKSITIRARDVLEKTNATFPSAVFNATDHPKALDELYGQTIPIIYGDWSESVTTNTASVPAYAINAADIFVNNEELTVTIALGTPAVFTAPGHRLEANDEIDLMTEGSLPTGINQGKHYIKTVLSSSTFTISNTLGGVALNASGTQSGRHYVTRHSNEPHENVKCVIAANTLFLFDSSNVYVRRSGVYYRVPSTEIQNIAVAKNSFEILQNNGTWFDGAKYFFNKTDEIFVRCKGKSLAGYDDNAVAIAQDILTTYAGVVSGDLDASWSTYKTKATPSTGAISTWKARAWIGEPTLAMEYAVNLLQQVRLQLFQNKNAKLDLHALHWDEFDETPSFIAKNWDIERESLRPTLDVQNNFNRSRAIYGYSPESKESIFSTAWYINSAAISQTNRTLTRELDYPNLYRLADVEIQVKETLKLASGYREVIELTLTNRAILQDIGEWILLDVQVGSVQLNGVPCLIREIGYSPDGLKLPVKLWSFAMLPFGSWNPGFAGIVGGESATISAE